MSNPRTLTFTDTLSIAVLAILLTLALPPAASAGPVPALGELIGVGTLTLDFEQADPEPHIYVIMKASMNEWIVISSEEDLQEQATLKWKAQVSCPYRLFSLEGEHPSGWNDTAVVGQSLNATTSNVTGTATLQSYRVQTLVDECVRRSSLSSSGQNAELDPYDEDPAKHSFLLKGEGADRLLIDQVCSWWDGSKQQLYTETFAPIARVHCVDESVYPLVVG